MSNRMSFQLLVALCFSLTSWLAYATETQAVDGSTVVVDSTTNGSSSVSNVDADGNLLSAVKVSPTGELTSPAYPDTNPGVVPQMNVDANGNLTSVTNVNPDGTVESSVTW